MNVNIIIIIIYYNESSELKFYLSTNGSNSRTFHEILFFLYVLPMTKCTPKNPRRIKPPFHETAQSRERDIPQLYTLTPFPAKKPLCWPAKKEKKSSARIQSERGAAERKARRICAHQFPAARAVRSKADGRL